MVFIHQLPVGALQLLILCEWGDGESTLSNLPFLLFSSHAFPSLLPPTLPHHTFFPPSSPQLPHRTSSPPLYYVPHIPPTTPFPLSPSPDFHPLPSPPPNHTSPSSSHPSHLSTSFLSPSFSLLGSHTPSTPLPLPSSTQGLLTLSLMALYSALRCPHSFLYAFSRCTSSSRLSFTCFSSSNCPVRA